VTTKKVGAVLIDFTPSCRNTQSHDGVGYYKIDFENMLFSDNGWYTIRDYKGRIIGPHPELNEVFGSLKNYYSDQSCGNMVIVGNNNTQIVNDVDSNNPNLPDWLILPQSIDYYTSTSNFPLKATLFNTIYQYAVNEFGATLMESFDAVVFIYGGNTVSGQLYPGEIGDRWCMSEMGSGHFTHIGGHAHEFGHVIGAADEYKGSINPYYYCLMGWGDENGPNQNSACPASLSPYYRIIFGWVSPITLNVGTSNQQIIYDGTDPNFYKVAIPNSGEYFILERRIGENWDEYTPNADGNNDLDGIYIWHIDPSTPVYASDDVVLEAADNSWSSFPGNDLFPYPSTSLQDFNPISSPSSNMRDGTYSNIAIEDIEFVATGDGYGIVDILNPPPYIPQGFSSVWYNFHPKIYWTANTEYDFDHYEIWKKRGSGSWFLRTTTTATYWIDEQEDKYTFPSTKEYIYYKICAVDDASNKSNYTAEKSFCVNAWLEKSNPADSGAVALASNTPEVLLLYPSAPNPFNISTTIRFSLPTATSVDLFICDLNGRIVRQLIRSETFPANYHSVVWDGNNDAGQRIPSGLYLIIFETRERVFQQKLIMLK